MGGDVFPGDEVEEPVFVLDGNGGAIRHYCELYWEMKWRVIVKANSKGVQSMGTLNPQGTTRKLDLVASWLLQGDQQN
jgi:hypothetical protein